jgi:hypothetical protein
MSWRVSTPLTVVAFQTGVPLAGFEDTMTVGPSAMTQSAVLEQEMEGS